MIYELPHFVFFRVALSEILKSGIKTEQKIIKLGAWEGNIAKE